MVRHDLECTCGTITLDVLVDPDHLPNCHRCIGGHISIVYLPQAIRTAACHPSETCVVYYSPKEGKYQYPARNDIPVPGRLQKRGYERVEMRSLSDIQRFEKKHGVVNERIWFDKGSGRGMEDQGR